MTDKIQDLTKKELQETIDLYSPVKEHNTIAKIIVDIYQKELDERAN
jgi:hypothetical protein